MNAIQRYINGAGREKARWIARIIPKSIKQMIKKRSLPNVINVERKPYRSGIYPGGVNLFGYLKAQMGLGQGARLYADAIIASCIPHTLINTTVGNPSSHDDVAYDNQFSGLATYNTNILHVNAEQLPLLISSYPSVTWDQRYHIGVWLWELEDFPEEWNNSFTYLDEIWTPSQFTSRAIRKNTSLPVITVPYGIRADVNSLFDRKYFGLPAGQFLFLSMFDAHSMISRKNPLGAIDAFRTAFGNTRSDVGLVIKVNNAGKKDLSILHKCIGKSPNVYIVNKTMSKTEVNSLIKCCDTFVSLHRSEGFGLVIAEAMFLGVPAIATNWSANIDFMDETNSCPVDYSLIDTKYDYYMSKPGQQWANPKIEHAAYYMRKLFFEASYRNQISLAAQNYITENFSISKSGETMRERLGKIGVL